MKRNEKKLILDKLARIELFLTEERLIARKQKDWDALLDSAQSVKEARREFLRTCNEEFCS